MVAPIHVNAPPQMINQRLLVIVLYLPHLMSARHPARGYRRDREEQRSRKILVHRFEVY